jgi:hypothetical protein
MTFPNLDNSSIELDKVKVFSNLKSSVYNLLWQTWSEENEIGLNLFYLFIYVMHYL